MRRTRNPVYGNPVSRVQIPPFPPIIKDLWSFCHLWKSSRFFATGQICDRRLQNVCHNFRVFLQFSRDKADILLDCFGMLPCFIFLFSPGFAISVRINSSRYFPGKIGVRCSDICLSETRLFCRFFPLTGEGGFIRCAAQFVTGFLSSS